MIHQITYAAILAGAILFVIFLFLECLLHAEINECEHENRTTYDSYHKQVCIDCGAEFLTTEIKK